MFAIGQSNFLQALGWAVLNSLWQMALLWVVYQFVTAVFKVNKSSQKGNLATLLLFSGSAWFAFTFFSILADSPVSTTGYTSFVTIQGNSAVNDWLYHHVTNSIHCLSCFTYSADSQFYQELQVCSGYPELWIKQGQCKMENVCA